MIGSSSVNKEHIFYKTDVTKLAKNDHLKIYSNIDDKNLKFDLFPPNVKNMIKNFVYRVPGQFGFYFRSKEFHKKIHLGKNIK